MAFDPYKTQVEPTRNPADGEKLSGWWELLEYDWDDVTPKIYFSASVAHPVLVAEVRHIITTAFTGTAQIDVGDSSAADYWFVHGDTGVADNTSVTSLNATTPRHGKLYEANDYVAIDVSQVVSAGHGKLLAYLIRF